MFIKIKNIRLTHLLITGLIIICCVAFQKPVNTRCDIIPAPRQIHFDRGYFGIDGKTKIVCTNSEMKAEAVKLQQYLTDVAGKKLTIVEDETLQKNVIILETTGGMDEEAYDLNIGAKKIICKASSPAGMFYALQSLIQLTEPSGRIPCMDIADQPYSEWRGLMLDVSRHFFDKEVVKQQLDVMAHLKMNRYHWHLTDETGWRIEIKQYPELTGIGAEGNWSDRNAPRTFYTQDDIREVVEYARERHIMVIPEIDMPGHATAATRAYPEVSGGGTGRWAGFTFHPAKESVYEFLNHILKEVAELFPAPYIHIGGDEVHFGNQSWYSDPVIQKFIRDKQLGNEVGLEHYFVRRACEMVNHLGKTMIGWDEITTSGVSPDHAVVMWWRHDRKNALTDVLDKGFRVILNPRIPCYLDFVQDESHKIGRRWSGAFGSLSLAYHFPSEIQPLISGRDQQIMGIQANIWTERIADKKRLDFMAFPRVAALAESAWTNATEKDEAGFEERIKLFLKYLDDLKIYYFNPFDKLSTPEPWGPEKADVVAEG